MPLEREPSLEPEVQRALDRLFDAGMIDVRKDREGKMMVRPTESMMAVSPAEVIAILDDLDRNIGTTEKFDDDRENIAWLLRADLLEPYVKEDGVTWVRPTEVARMSYPAEEHDWERPLRLPPEP